MAVVIAGRFYARDVKAKSRLDAFKSQSSGVKTGRIKPEGETTTITTSACSRRTLLLSLPRTQALLSL